MSMVRGPLGTSRLPPELRFDLVNACEQCVAARAGFHFHDHVQEPGLLAQILRLGFVDGGSPHGRGRRQLPRCSSAWRRIASRSPRLDPSER